jgi:HPt (histidine-containing phosphotransfer) domain-containing protein
MGYEQSALTIVRAGLCSRIDDLAQSLARLRTDQLCSEIDDIRTTAARYGLEPVRQIARAMEMRLARENGTSMMLPWLDLLREAATCDRVDNDAADSFLASMTVRIGL